MRNQAAPQTEPVQRRELAPERLEDIARRFRMRLPLGGDETEKAQRVRTAFEGFAGGVIRLFPGEGRETELFLEALEVALLWATRGIFRENPINPPFDPDTPTPEGAKAPPVGRPPSPPGVVDGGTMQVVDEPVRSPGDAIRAAGASVAEAQAGLEALVKAGSEMPLPSPEEGDAPPA